MPPKKAASKAHSERLPSQSLAREPVHLRLTELCRGAIREGKFPAGERFPSERELAERYEVSRATANKAIATLVTEGWLELKPGVGSRVRPYRRLFAAISGMEDFDGPVRELGLVPETQVLVFTHRLSPAAPEAVRQGLELDAMDSEPLVYLERLRLADGVPLLLESRWIRARLANQLRKADVAEGSFYRLLEERFALPLTGEAHSLSSVLLDEEAAQLFGITPPHSALQLEGTGFLEGNVPLFYQRLLYRGDRYQLLNETRGPGEASLSLRLRAD